MAADQPVPNFKVGPFIWKIFASAQTTLTTTTGLLSTMAIVKSIFLDAKQNGRRKNDCRLPTLQFSSNARLFSFRNQKRIRITLSNSIMTSESHILPCDNAAYANKKPEIKMAVNGNTLMQYLYALSNSNRK